MSTPPLLRFRTLPEVIVLTDQEFIRYSRQIMLADIGETGQLRLKQAKVLIVGLGGLGTVAASYLAGAGVGELWLVDGDEVDLSNLPRQLLYDLDSIENAKVYEARQRLLEANPEVTIHAEMGRVSFPELQTLVSQVDLVLDCSDNMATRYAINKACFTQGVELLSAAAIGWQGQLLMFSPNSPEFGCYQCLYPDAGEQTANCQSAGVIGPVVGQIASLQALEAIKHLAGLGSSLTESLLCFNGKTLSWQILTRQRDPQCDICARADSLLTEIIK